MDTSLFQYLKQNINQKSASLYTVIAGEHQGEQLLMSEGKEVCFDKALLPDFLINHTEMLRGINGCGEILIENNRVFYEQITAGDSLVILGAGHVSVSIIQIGKMTGFQVTVIDDRPFFAGRAKEAGADHVICDSFENALGQISGDSHTYFVIVTRGHRYDSLCLKKAILKENAYIGLMGSRRRVALLKTQLQEEGISARLLQRVHMPIGLPIGAETPEEIAVSVMSEIIQVRRKETNTEGFSRDLILALTDEMQPGGNDDCGPVLAVIVSRKGPAPRQIGTRMLVYRNGRIIGTIGGGCMESAVIRQAQRMLITGVKYRLIKADMTGENSDDEEKELLCGGSVEVFLQQL